MAVKTDRPSARRTGRSALEPYLDEIEAIRVSVNDAVMRSADAFFVRYEASGQDPTVLADWFKPRCWREIEYVFMLGEQIRRYGFTFERKHVVSLARQLEEEAEHYEGVGRIIESLGGDVPIEVPEPAREWSAFLWECLDRHRLAAIAAWYTSESSSLGLLDASVAAGERYEMPFVLRFYTQVIKDEKFHIGLGRLLLERYSETAGDAQEVMRAIRGMADIIHGRARANEVATA